ncbi:CRE-GLB-16 protein [Aphelenchoides avenae]|nr:CRE-GLB-16 protein [Aphelenchus avenae]
MFLIAKIVRGRRLLHELEQEEKEKKREEEREKEREKHKEQQRENEQYKSQMPGTSQDAEIGADVPPKLQRRKKTVRQKTELSLPCDPEADDRDSAGVPRMRRTSSMPSVYDAENKYQTGRVRHYNYDVKLSKLQKRALRFTWHRLQTRNGGKRVENVFEEVYDRMMRQTSVMREMFTTRTFLSAMSKNDVATLRDHARFTVKMIDAVIKNLDMDERKRSDTGSEYDPIRLGRVHAALRPYGFTGNLWEKLGETIVDVVLSQEAVRDLPGAGQAWVILTACLVDQVSHCILGQNEPSFLQLRAGFDSAKSEANAAARTSSTGCPVSGQAQNNRVLRTLPQTPKCPYDGTANAEDHFELLKKQQYEDILYADAVFTASQEKLNQQPPRRSSQPYEVLYATEFGLDAPYGVTDRNGTRHSPQATPPRRQSQSPQYHGQRRSSQPVIVHESVQQRRATPPNLAMQLASRMMSSVSPAHAGGSGGAEKVYTTVQYVTTR